MNRRRISKQKSASTGYVIGAMLYVVTEAARKVCRAVRSVIMQRGKYGRPILWYRYVENTMLFMEVTLSFMLLVSMLINFATGRINRRPDADRTYFEASTADVTVETTPGTEAEESPSVDEEAIALARLADSAAKGRSDEVKRIIMWVAINRSEDRSNGYGRSLLEEISRPRQWQQYDETAPYLESTLVLAKGVLDTWRSGGPRPIYSDMLWAVLNGDGSITVRNKFRESKNMASATFGQ